MFGSTIEVRSWRDMIAIVAASALFSVALSVTASQGLIADLPAPQQHRLLELAVGVPLICATICGSVLAALIRRTTLLRDEMARLAVTDSLTPNNNRRGFFEKARALLSSPLAEGYFLFVVDLDHFKHVNEVYGHEGGDKALVEVGRALNMLFGDNDAVGRTGGEEFAVLAHTDPNCAPAAIAEAIRDQIAPLSIPFDEDYIVLTASIGYAAVRSAAELEAAFGRADRALFRAKQSGRDCAEYAIAV